jgi:hypothetical protein
MEIVAKQFESVPLEITVLDADDQPVDFTLGSDTVVEIRIKYQFGDLIVDTPDIVDNVLTYVMDPDQTGLVGLYTYEFWVYMNGNQSCVDNGTVQIVSSLNEAQA